MLGPSKPHGGGMECQEAGASALRLGVVSVTATATPRMRAVATRFSGRYDAYRAEGISHPAAYVMASAESAAYLREMDRERVFA